MLSTTEAVGASWGEYEASRDRRRLPPAAKLLSAYVLEGKYRAQREDRGGAALSTMATMVPFKLSSARPWEVKSSPEQWQHLVDRTVENIVENTTGTGWKPVQVEDAKEFWSACCTTDLVRVAALAFLGATVVTVNMKSTKQDLIEALVADEIQLCPPYILKGLYESMGTTAPISNPGGNVAPRDSEVPPGSPRRQADKARPERIVDVGTPQKAAVSPSEGHGTATPVERMATDMVAAILQAFQSVGAVGKVNDPAAPSGAKAAEPADRHWHFSH